MVRAAGRGLVRAGGVLGLCPHSLRYALAAQASPSWLALHAHSSGFALTTIKWIHLLKLNEFIYFALQKIYEFIYSMHSYLYEFIYLNHWIQQIYEFESFGRGKKNQMKCAPMSDFKSLSTYVDCTNFKSYFPRQLGHSYFLFLRVFITFFIETHWAP